MDLKNQIQNREIKFRGQRADNNEWVYGCLVNNMWTYSELSKYKTGTPVCEIITGEYESDCWEDAICEEQLIVQVKPETVGQFTGLTDINGKEIYEGDILKDKSGSICFVVWDIITFAVESPGSQAIDVEPVLFYTESEVIGNIYQDKHLIS